MIQWFFKKSTTLYFCFRKTSNLSELEEKHDWYIISVHPPRYDALLKSCYCATSHRVWDFILRLILIWFCLGRCQAGKIDSAPSEDPNEKSRKPQPTVLVTPYVLLKWTRRAVAQNEAQWRRFSSFLSSAAPIRPNALYESCPLIPFTPLSLSLSLSPFA